MSFALVYIDVSFCRLSRVLFPVVPALLVTLTMTKREKTPTKAAREDPRPQSHNTYCSYTYLPAWVISNTRQQQNPRRTVTKKSEQG